MASSASARFVGWLFRTKLQLHDLLAVIVESIQIIDGAVDYISIILGTDVLNPRVRYFCERRLNERKHQTFLDVEEKGTRVVFS